MKTKLFALLTALSLVSAPAFAEIDLTPYEVTDDACRSSCSFNPVWCSSTTTVG